MCEDSAVSQCIVEFAEHIDSFRVGIRFRHYVSLIHNIIHNISDTRAFIDDLKTEMVIEPELDSESSSPSVGK
ncbi:hypothetical protein RchiOBHm_Chr7g0229851 [Rosa chinensis]|uniref:Uncharacterized protein n=1 Tax=Rosa chinensis TaxID=74649 RepID=A0A2P6PF85_ROSCH|nr:hypothetical protein RchiOBHm_Chr7g0229851 [Rosa chinensis]